MFLQRKKTFIGRRFYSLIVSSFLTIISLIILVNCSESSTPSEETAPGLSLKVVDGSGNAISGADVHLIFLDIPLPLVQTLRSLVPSTQSVQLNYFRADSSADQITIHWQTSEQTDNSAFLIDRSEDGVSFSQVYETPGTGAGTITETKTYTYIDDSLQYRLQYFYRLADRDMNGIVTYHDTISATPDSFAVIPPQSSRLQQNFPNPFDGSTDIPFEVATSQSVNISLVDKRTGTMVRQLIDATLPAGSYRVVWDGTDEDSRYVTNAIYTCRMQVPDTLLEIDICMQYIDTAAFSLRDIKSLLQTDGDGGVFVPLEQLDLELQVPFADSEGRNLGVIGVADSWTVVLRKDGFQDLVGEISIDSENGGSATLTMVQ